MRYLFWLGLQRYHPEVTEDGAGDMIDALGGFVDAMPVLTDAILFGPETRGLPDDVLAQFSDDEKIRIPMQAQSRSLNLANAVAIALYEAWRQFDYIGA